MYPGGFSGDSSYITDVWDLCGGRSADGSCCLWHKKQKRDFTGSRGNLPYIGGSWRSHAGACRKQPGKKSYKMDAGKLSGQAVSGCRSCIPVCMAFTVSASFEHPKRGKQAFKKCYLVLCRPDHKDQRPDRYRKPFKSSCKRSAGPCSYSRTDETSLPGSKRGHVCSLSMYRQQWHPSSCKDRRNESGRREGKLCDTKAMDRYNKGKLISP